MKTFYKGNASQKGLLSDWGFSSKDSAIYLQLVRQTFWNANTKKPSFSAGETIRVKFGTTELFGIIAALQGVRPWSFFHTFNQDKTSGSLKSLVYKKDDKDIPIVALYVKRGEKVFNTAYTLDEADELANFLLFAAGHINNALYAVEKKRAEEYQKNKAKNPEQSPQPAAPQKAEEPVEQLVL